MLKSGKSAGQEVKKEAQTAPSDQSLKIVQLHPLAGSV